MSNAQRSTSARNTGNVVWTGSNTTAAAPMQLGPKPVLRINAPAAIAGDKALGLAAFGPDISTVNISGNVVLADDGVVPNADVCSAIMNNVSGKIALIERGTCTFVSKVLLAQMSGAIGAIIYNNVTGAPVTMEWIRSTITIPSVMISDVDGAAIIAQLGIHGRQRQHHHRRTNWRARCWDARSSTPNPYASGSSVSHWDTSHFEHVDGARINSITERPI
jgi:hypothetical protein